MFAITAIFNCLILDGAKPSEKEPEPPQAAKSAEPAGATSKEEVHPGKEKEETAE